MARYFERLTDRSALPAAGARRRRSQLAHLRAAAAAGPRRTCRAAQFIKAMHERGIGVGVHYPALHLFTAYRELGYTRGRLPQRRADRPRDCDPAAVSDHAARRRGPGVRCSRARCSRKPGRDTVERRISRRTLGRIAPCRRRDLSVIIPVYNEEEGLPALFARLYPALDALGIAYEIVFINDGSRDRSAALLREQFQQRPDVTRVILFNGNFGQHMAIMAGFAHARGRRVVTLDADLQNPPEEIGNLLAADGPGPRLRRHHPPQAAGQRVSALGVARDEPGARAHHAGKHDRPGLHAARLQPRHRRRDGELARGQHLHPGARLHLRRQPDRDRGRARGARRRRIQVFARTS